MKIGLVFYDWLDGLVQSKSIYNTEEGVELSKGDFHHGSTFDATIECDDPEELLRAIKQGFRPVFYAVRRRDAN